MGSLNVNELDFALIKQNIKDYLSGQTEFQDYNFEGSGMNVLMDLLAYATHYMGVYGNMTFNEMFITTALLRSSVTSKAAELGYIPSQMTSSTATINISALSATDITIPVGTKFSGTNEFGKGFSFVTVAEHIMTSDSTTATAEIPIYEGTLALDQWIYADGANQRFIFSNTNIDDKHLTVTVKENTSSTTYVEWFKFDNIVNITGETEAYFLRETIEEAYEIYFGSGTIGKALVNGNVVLAQYLVSNGAEANNISTFSLNAGFDGHPKGDFTVTTVAESTEGSDREHLDKIKHNAPLYYQTQNRSTTENDYTSILLKEFDYIQAISVWGGEENDPPYYGRVMISIKPEGASELTEQAQANILAHLDNFKVTGIVPILVTPAYSYIDVEAFVKYNAHLTTQTEETIASIVDTAIDDHFTENLYAFNSTLKYSELTTDIDSSDKSIFSNFVELTLRSDILISPAFINSPFTYTISFNNPVKAGTVIMEWTNSSSQAMKITDSGSDGILHLYQDGELQVGATNVGTVDYTLGKVVLINFNPVLSATDTLNMYADPDTYDIETIQNNILLKGAVKVNVERVII